MKKKQKRGFLVALMIGFDERTFHSWKVYSHSVRANQSIRLPRKWKYLDENQVYHIFEKLINLIRKAVREGLKSVLLVSPPRTLRSKSFFEHVQKHHQWLLKGYNRVSFGEIEGKANSLESVEALISQEDTEEIIEKTVVSEVNHIIKRLNKLINLGDPNNLLLYDLDDIEEVVYEGGKKDRSAAQKVALLVISENFFNRHKNKSRIHRLKQISQNKGIKTRIISKENPQIDYFDQFGGILALRKKK